MQVINIKQLYSGRPDARDEINFDGYEEFIKTFVKPDTINIDSLISGTSCFITGYKGTGKTALLFYIDNILNQIDSSSCSSFIFFKEDFSDTKKQELESMSQRIMTSISIQEGTMLENTDFEYIWRWILLKRIVSDNQEYNYGLFVKDDNWDLFEKIVSSIDSPTNMRKNIITPKIKFSMPITDTSTSAVFSPEFEVDFQNGKNNDNLLKFMSVIDSAEQVLSSLNRTDIPYTIFIDELEAYYGDENVFKRDLYLIRDLVLTVKRFNTNFASKKHKKTKIICSLRTEIINAISRFIVTKELNKVTSGFEVPLIWDYNNTSSYVHPIVQILLKRIFICENSEKFDSKNIYSRWFPENVNGIEPASYILNNSWCKPRDIVRLLISAQNGIRGNDTVFKQSTFNSIYKRYSIESLSEIKEEMRALYTSEEIETIINCFTGYKTIFSVSQLQKRISQYYVHTILDLKFNQVIRDLYRLGFVGNYLPSAKTYRWQHKGDENVILSNDWRIMIHFALQGALSIGRRQDYGFNKGELPQPGDMVEATVYKVIPMFALVKFNNFDTEYYGSIHISQISNSYVQNIFRTVFVGDEFRAKILKYNDKFNSWDLTLRYVAPNEEKTPLI